MRKFITLSFIALLIAAKASAQTPILTEGLGGDDRGYIVKVGDAAPDEIGRAHV